MTLDRQPIQIAGLGHQKMFALWLNNFQLKDKLALIESLRDSEMHVPFALAVEQFVDDFGQSFSEDAPYPKRIGRWVGLHAPMPVVERLMAWSVTEGPHSKSSRYRGEFRQALKGALSIDRSKRPPLTEAA